MDDLAVILREAEEVAKALERIEAQERAQAAAVDPLAFAQQVQFAPDPWQERVLQWTGKRLLLNCCRQAGKSTTTSVLALFRALSAPRSLILLISPSDRQSGELFRKVTDAMSQLPSRPATTEDNKRSLTFANGSRIVSLPSSEATIRGYSAVSLIIEDEAAFVDDALNAAVRPMLAVSNGQLILMSTPNGRRGHFFEAWEHGGPHWERVEVTASQVPRISPAFLAEERRIMGERYRQEYEGAFINAATGRVYGAYDPERNDVDRLPDSSQWTYLLGIDVGIVDQCGLTVLAFRPHDPCVYVAESYRISATPTTLSEEVRRLEQTYKFAVMVLDTGGMGKAFEAEMRARFRLPVQAAEKHAKVGNITLMNDALRAGRMKLVRDKCRHLSEEWLTLPWAENPEGIETRQKEADGFDNHASDSCLYGWRAAWAYLAKPAPEPTPQNSKEWEAKQADNRRSAAKKAADKKAWWKR